MVTDAAAVLAEAWGHIPQSRETTAGIGSFTRTRVERILSLVAGLSCLALGAQAFVAALGPSAESPEWHLALMVLVFVPLVAMVLACLVGRGVRLTAGVFAVAYVVALILWPVATAGTAPSGDEPWLWYLLNLSTLAAVLSFPLPLQIVWTVVVPLLFGFVRLLQTGFERDLWIAVGLDVSFALILGGLLLALGWVFRSVAANVDETRARAVDSYTRAAAAEAAEGERVAVAALMHDSVLAALIAAERAETEREQTLAVAMAREALTRLANTEQDPEEGSDEPRPAASVADDIEHAAADLGADLRIERVVDAATPDVPGRVCRALVLAATQAIVNGLDHAGGRGLSVVVRARPAPTRIEIDVRDSGGGFDLAAVPDDRLGIRGSIIARVAAVGGTADISSSASGTRVTLAWEDAP